MLKTETKLKKRKLKTVAIIVLSVLTMLSFTLLLPQFSFAQAATTNTDNYEKRFSKDEHSNRRRLWSYCSYNYSR